MDDYNVVHPVQFVPPERRVRVSGTMVREAMAAGDDVYRALVPPVIADFLERRGWLERFRAEFGAETIAAAGKIRASLTG